MIGVDTNVLLRYLMQDGEDQFTRADRFFAERTAADPVFVSLVVMIETTWVLARRYRRAPAEVARAVTGLLAADEIVVQAPDVVRRALRDIHGTRAELADAVIARLAIDADSDHTVTFDRKAAELPGMIAL